jgi:hypothetical protein
MVYCRECGAAIGEANTFCTACGAGILPAAEDYGHAASPETGAGPDRFLCWSRKIPLITNPYLVLQCIFVPLGIAIVMGGFFALITGEVWGMFTLFLVLGAGLSVLMLVILAVLQVVTGGGLLTEFFISPEGVAHNAGSTTRALDRVSAGGSAVLGSMSGTGAGLIAISQENNQLRWEDVRYVSVYPSVQSIVFRSRYLIGPVVLYCTKENFPHVLALVKEYAPAVARAQLS